MSDRVDRSNGSTPLGGGTSSQPRAMIHKKILSIAEENPETSLEGIADQVNGASLAFVERVLEEYGDPAERYNGTDRLTDRSVPIDASTEETTVHHDGDGTEPDTSTHTDSADRKSEEDPDRPEASVTETSGAVVAESPEDTDVTGSVDDSEMTDSSEHVDGETVTDPGDLPDRLHQTLTVVHEFPTATQEEIGEQLGVSRATISKRLADVDGFEWETRQEFVTRLFGAQELDENERGESQERGAVDQQSVEHLAERLGELESKFQDNHRSASLAMAEPELVHKLVHACMDAEYIGRDDELRILRHLLPSK